MKSLGKWKKTAGKISAVSGYSESTANDIEIIKLIKLLKDES